MAEGFDLKQWKAEAANALESKKARLEDLQLQVKELSAEIKEIEKVVGVASSRPTRIRFRPQILKYAEGSTLSQFYALDLQREIWPEEGEDILEPLMRSMARIALDMPEEWDYEDDSARLIRR